MPLRISVHPFVCLSNCIMGCLTHSLLPSGFVEHIDAIDNGIAVSEGPLRYQISTTLSSRVGNLNPRYARPQHTLHARGYITPCPSPHVVGGMKTPVHTPATSASLLPSCSRAQSSWKKCSIWRRPGGLPAPEWRGVYKTEALCTPLAVWWSWISAVPGRSTSSNWRRRWVGGAPL